MLPDFDQHLLPLPPRFDERNQAKKYKLSEEADKEKTRRKWKKVLIEIRKQHHHVVN
jgi:hypothetical protein